MFQNNLLSVFLFSAACLGIHACAAGRKSGAVSKNETISNADSASNIASAPLPMSDLPLLKNETNTKLTVLDTPVSTQLIWLDFESGYVKASKENKILLVDVYTNWCGWCKVMDQKTYSQAAVIEKINRHFVPVKLNPEIARVYRFADTSMAADELHRWLGTGKTYGYPSAYFIMNPGKGFETYIQTGFLEEKEFMDILNLIIAKKK